MTAPLLAAVARLVTGANVRWLCPPDARQRIYFANHTSHLDALVLWAVLPPNLRQLVRPVAAKDYWTKSSLRKCVATKFLNAVLIERNKVSAEDNPVATMLEAMGKCYSLILFPEGTRSAGPEMRPFKGGLHHLGKHRPDVELVPVHIDNLNRILPKGEFLPVPMLSCVTFGRPIHVEPNEGKLEFLKRAQEAVSGLRQT